MNLLMKLFCLTIGVFFSKAALAQEAVTWNNHHPFKNKNYVVSIKKIADVAEAEIYFLKQTPSSTKTIWKEIITINQPKMAVNFDDFNGDGVKDLLVFATSGARGNNEFYYLYLVKGDSLIKVKNFEQIVNPIYNKHYNVIISYGYAAKNSYSIYKIAPNYRAVKIGDSFEDSFDSDTDELNRRIEQILKSKK